MLRPSIFRSNLMDNVFDNFFDDQWSNFGVNQISAMSTDIKESENGYEIDMELPGFAKEDVKAELKDGYMTVKAVHNESKEEKDEEGKRYIRRERYSGHYQRSFYVGEDLNEDDIKASFKDGILTVSIPKKEAKPKIEEKKYITIE